MEILFTKLFEIFSLEYMFSVIVASYLVIMLADVINGKRVTPSWMKRLITCFTGSVLLVVFMKFTDVTFQSLMASFFAAVFVYDTAIKVLIEKFNIGYRK